jgi:hypothetical protein
MPTVTCPGCTRRIPLSFDELALTIECAQCGTRFAACSGEVLHLPARIEAPAPQAEENDEDEEDAPRIELRSTICPHCDRTILVPAEAWGCKVACSACDFSFVARERIALDVPARPGQLPTGPGPGEVQCPLCSAVGPPTVRSEVSSTGWLVFFGLLLTCFPFAPLAFFIREPVQRCASCRLRLKPSLGYVPHEPFAPDAAAGRFHDDTAKSRPVHVAGYWRPDGTYVPRHGRSRPRG